MTQFMPPPETYESEIGSQPMMCQVHTGAYVSILDICDDGAGGVVVRPYLHTWVCMPLPEYRSTQSNASSVDL